MYIYPCILRKLSTDIYSLNEAHFSYSLKFGVVFNLLIILVLAKLLVHFTNIIFMKVLVMTELCIGISSYKGSFKLSYQKYRLIVIKDKVYHISWLSDLKFRFPQFEIFYEKNLKWPPTYILKRCHTMLFELTLPLITIPKISDINFYQRDVDFFKSIYCRP